MSQWQSLETVPRDGTEVLICVGQHGLHSKGRVVAYWLDGVWHSTFCVDRYAFEEEESVLAWMPLPPPPKEE